MRDLEEDQPLTVKEAKAGSAIWIEQISPPLWFIEEVDDNDVVEVLREAGKHVQLNVKFKGGSKRRRNRLSKAFAP